MYASGLFIGIFMASVYKSIAIKYISDDILTTAGALGSFCNGLSRLFWAS